MREASEKQIQFLINHCGVSREDAISMRYEKVSAMIGETTARWADSSPGMYGDNLEVDDMDEDELDDYNLDADLRESYGGDA